MSKRHTHEEASDSSEFSTIKFFLALQEALGECREFPLRKDDIVINHDAYEALGSDVSSRRPFATIGIPSASSDSDIRFTCEFFEESLCFTLPDFFAPVFMPYEEIDDSEQLAATKLAHFLIALSNGQLSFLLSLEEETDIVHSIELLYRVPNEKQQTVLGSILFFMNRKRRVFPDQVLTTKHDTNKADLPSVEISKKLATVLLIGDTEGVPIIRKTITNLDEPLRVDDAKKAIDDYAEEKAAEVVKKFDTWTGYDYESPENTSYKSLYMHYSHARHTSVLWVSLAILLLGGIFIGWFQSLVVFLVLMVVNGILLMFLKGRINPAIHTIMKVFCGYIAALMTFFFLIDIPDKTIFAWVLIIALVAEVLECIILDFYYGIRRIRKKES